MGFELLLLLPCIVSANDGWYQSSGSPYAFDKKHPDIQLVREVAHFDLGDKEMSVNVTFWFKNHGKAQKVTMAFPEESERENDPLQDFKSQVDGRRVKVTRKVLEHNREEGQMKAVWLKTVDFKAGQVREVKVAYKQFVSGDTSGNRWYGYLFKTGVTWRGVVESLKITYSFESLKKLSRPEVALESEVETVSPYQKKFKATGLKTGSYELHDVVPNFSWGADMITGFWSVFVNNLQVPLKLLYFPAHGSGTDVRVTVRSLPTVLSVLSRFDRTGAFSLESLDEALEVIGVSPRIRRKTKMELFGVTWGDELEYVYLKDVVEALGGTYRYDVKEDTVFITVPTKPK